MDESRPKEMFSVMPVVLCKSMPMKDDAKVDPTIYPCPVYRTPMRGAGNYIFNAQLKTPAKHPPRKWILGGVACILDVEGVSDEVKTAGEKK